MNLTNETNKAKCERLNNNRQQKQLLALSLSSPQFIVDAYIKCWSAIVDWNTFAKWVVVVCLDDYITPTNFTRNSFIKVAALFVVFVLGKSWIQHSQYNRSKYIYDNQIHLALKRIARHVDLCVFLACAHQTLSIAIINGCIRRKVNKANWWRQQQMAQESRINTPFFGYDWRIIFDVSRSSP